MEEGGRIERLFNKFVQVRKKKYYVSMVIAHHRDCLREIVKSVKKYKYNSWIWEKNEK